jgi:hypothetical protein
VSQGTLCLTTPPHILEQEEMRALDAGRWARGTGRGNSILLARYDQSTIHPTLRPSRALGHKVPQRTDLDGLLGLLIARQREVPFDPRPLRTYLLGRYSRCLSLKW